MTESIPEISRAERIARFLADEGFRPAIEDGDVGFKYQGRRYFVVIDEKDPQFYRVMKFNFWPIESEAERRAAYRAAGKVGSLTKGVKVIPEDDDVSAGVDLLVPDVESLLAVLLRSIDLCALGSDRFADFVREMTEEEAAAEPPGPATPPGPKTNGGE